MKVAAVQMACVVGDLEANTRKIEQFARQAHEMGAAMVVFPEMSDTGYAMDSIRECATDWKTGAVPTIRRLAHDLSIHIVCGVSERADNEIYNSQVVAGPSGEIIARYRKTHLFSPEPIREDRCFTPGRDLATFAAHEFNFGLSICYDLRFPELFRRLAVDHRVSAFLLSSAWPCPRAHHFRALAIARAIENQCYFVAANRAGIDDGARFCGESVIIDPAGAVLSSAPENDEEIIVAELSGDVLSSTRRQMPVFEHRRRDLYA